MEATKARLPRLAALSGPGAAIVFTASLVGFAAVRSDGYTHGTKAVSELGAVGAPNALAFNLGGFLLPGLLVVLLAISLHQRLAGRGRTGPALLALGGLAFAGAGLFPIDMDARTSPTSIGHLVAAQVSGFAWAAALFWLAPRLRNTPGLEGFGRASPWFALFLLANIGWQVAWQTLGAFPPGWGQRIAFAGYYLWCAGAGLLLAARPAASGRE